jgi:integrase/recombinase XerD
VVVYYVFLVAISEDMKIYFTHTNYYLLEQNTMSQAKTLTQPEIKQVLAMIALDKHAKRNRAMFLLTTLGGLRVGEVANLRYCDVID